MPNELDMLEWNMGGMKIKEASAMSFLQWVAKKISGVPAYKPAAVELSALVSSPPMARTMPDTAKIDIIKKMLSLDIKLP